MHGEEARSPQVKWRTYPRCGSRDADYDAAIEAPSLRSLLVPQAAAATLAMRPAAVGQRLHPVEVVNARGQRDRPHRHFRRGLQLVKLSRG
jgi:hypothetical protein